MRLCHGGGGGGCMYVCVCVCVCVCVTLIILIILSCDQQNKYVIISSLLFMMTSQFVLY